MSRRIVFDVSTLFAWTGHPVGIVRAQVELARWLLARHLHCAVLFVRFAHDRSRLEPVANEVVAKRLVEMEEVSVSAPSPQVMSEPEAPVERGTLFKMMRSGVLALTPPEQHRKLRTAWHIYRNAGLMEVNRTALRKVSRRFSRPAPPVIESRPDAPVEFSLSRSLPDAMRLADAHEAFLSADDVFVSVGLDWDFSNYELLYWLKKRFGFRFVGGFYDAIVLEYPEFATSPEFPPRLFRHFYLLNFLSDRVWCISQFTKNQYLHLAAANRIGDIPELEVIHLGDAINVQVMSDVPRRQPPLKPFVLYVSSIEARKNHRVLFNAWSEAIERGIELPDLICVGMRGWGVSDLLADYDANKSLQRHVHLLSDISDSALYELYETALFCVFPSFAEGWGLGAAEAMAHRKMCLISTAAALQEATRGMMPVLDANDPAGWLNAIQEYAREDGPRAELEALIRSRFVPKSWGAFAQEFFTFAGAAV